MNSTYPEETVFGTLRQEHASLLRQGAHPSEFGPDHYAELLANSVWDHHGERILSDRELIFFVVAIALSQASAAEVREMAEEQRRLGSPNLAQGLERIAREKEGDSL